MTTIKQAFEAGRVLAIQLKEYRNERGRTIAEVFDHPDGLAWVDIGWASPGGVSHNPYHLLSERLTQIDERTWESKTYVVTADDPKAVEELARWRELAEQHDYTREMCQKRLFIEFPE